jgi:hypothetical protein
VELKKSAQEYDQERFDCESLGRSAEARADVFDYFNRDRALPCCVVSGTTSRLSTFNRLPDTSGRVRFGG